VRIVAGNTTAVTLERCKVCDRIVYFAALCITRVKLGDVQPLKMDRQLILWGILLFVVAGKSAIASNQPSETEVRTALTAFLTAFDNLDWPAFRACFGPEPTMFHPAAPNTRRIETEEQFNSAWAGVFERIRKSSGRSSPPYMTLEPKDLRIDFLSGDVALVTFHIASPSEIDRRTLIFKHYGNAWKIVHIHASNLIAPSR